MPGTENAESTEKKGSTKQVFHGGEDDAGGEFGGRLVTIAADENDRGAFGFAHQEASRGGEFVGDREDRGGERLAVTVALAAQVVKDRNTGRAHGAVRQAKAPGAAEGIAADDGDLPSPRPPARAT